MIALLLLQAASPPPPPPMPPVDWSALPALNYRTEPAETAAVSAYVRDEVRAGRCARAIPTGGASLVVDLAVLATPQGTPRRVVPRAINCPSVEQYAAGLVSRRALANIDTAGATTDAWYRTSVTFSWPN